MSRSGSTLPPYERFLAYNVNVGYKIQDKRSVWVPDEKEGFLKGEVVKDEGGKLTLKMGDGDQRVVAEKDTQPANPAKFDGVKDCADLSYLNNATVLNNLRVRYDEDLIHTYSGLFLVVVNPYKWIPIYTPEIIQRYQGKRRTEVYPHTFAVADEAYRAMLRNKANQSMLITGESGAGKTENTKKVIQYLATIAGKASSGGKLEQQILQANPMLEAFGNAKTNKNDNSSRFGKFIRIQFNAGGIINGTTIQSYLLEKSRVVRQGKNERNFHIFYQLIEGTSSDQKKKYYIENARKYGFFTDKDAIKCRSLDDEKEFRDTVNAMTVIGLSEEEQDSVFRVMAGIMQSGNIKFSSSYGSEGSQIEDKSVLEKVATLWGLDRDKFERALIRPRIKAGTEVVEKHLSVEQAQYSRDAMCKSIYERVFLWLVKKLNSVLAADREANFIGVLDIAGFEIFEHNSFEQLCINFTNEKLQQFFNEHMFKLEQEEYAREKIEWKFIDFGMDSQQTIDLIEKRPNSILSFLDEETIFPRATNESLVNKFHTLAAKHKKYGKVQFKKLNFSIQHYAGDVIYDVSGWIDKNKDPLQDDIALALKNSEDDFVSNLFTAEDLDPRARAALLKEKAAAASGRKSRSRGGSKSGSGASFMTVATTYKEQLNDLMSTLRATEPHFIRCIIPNLRKKPGYLQADLVLEQLSCNGVLEGIRISRKGFPNRITYPEFVRRYYLLHPTLKRNEPESKGATKKVMQKVDSDIKEALKDKEDIVEPYYQFGTTKIFFRHGVLAKLEEWREQKLSQMVITIQAGARGWLGRSALKKIGQQTKAAGTLQKNLKNWVTMRDWMWWQLFIKSKPLLNKVGYEVIINDLQARVDKLEGEVSKLTEERDSSRKDYEAKKEELVQLQEDLSAAKGRVARLEQERDTLDKDNSDLMDQIDRLQDKLSDLNKTRTSADADVKDLEDELAEKEAELKKVQAMVLELEGTTQDQNGDLANKTRTASELESETAKLREHINVLELDLKDARATFEKESGRGDKLDAELKSTRQEAEDAKDDIADLKSVISTLQNAKQELEEQISASQGDLQKTKQDLSDTKAANKKLDGEIADVEDELDRAQREAANLQKKQKKLEEELERTQASAEQEKNALASANKRNKQLQADIEDLENQAASLESDRSRLEDAKRSNNAQLNDLRGKADNLRSSVDRLKRQLTELEADLQTKEEDVEKETEARNAAEKQVKALRSELKAQEEELEEAEARNAKLSKENNALEKRVKEVEADLADINSKVSSLSSQKAQAENDVAAAEDDLDALQKTISDLERKLKNLRADLDAEKARIEEERAEKERAEKAAKSAKSALADAQEELADLEEQRSSLESRLKEKAAEANELVAKKAQQGLAEAKSKARAEQKQTQQEIDSVRDALSKQEAQNRALQRDIKKKKAEVEEQEAENERATATRSKAKGAISKAESELSDNKSQLKKAQKEADKAQDEYDDIMKQLRALRDALRPAVEKTDSYKNDPQVGGMADPKARLLTRAASASARRSSRGLL